MDEAVSDQLIVEAMRVMYRGAVLGGATCSRNTKGLLVVNLGGGWTLVEQNPNTGSRFAVLVRTGRIRVAWLFSSHGYDGRLCWMYKGMTYVGTSVQFDVWKQKIYNVDNQ